METNIQKPTSQQTHQQSVLAKQTPDNEIQQARKPSGQANNHAAYDCQGASDKGEALRQT